MSNDFRGASRAAGREEENDRGERKGIKGEKRGREGVVPHLKQKSGCTTGREVRCLLNSQMLYLLHCAINLHLIKLVVI